MFFERALKHGKPPFESPNISPDSVDNRYRRHEFKKHLLNEQFLRMVGLVAFLCGGVLIAGNANAGGAGMCPNGSIWIQKSYICAPTAKPSAPSAPAPKPVKPTAPEAPGPEVTANPSKLPRCTQANWRDFCNIWPYPCKCKVKSKCTEPELTDEMRQASSPSPRATQGPTGCFANQTDGYIGD
jgi:hypothetical protein